MELPNFSPGKRKMTGLFMRDSLAPLRSAIDWNDGMLEKWNDGMAPFGQINAYGGDNSLRSP